MLKSIPYTVNPAIPQGHPLREAWEPRYNASQMLAYLALKAACGPDLKIRACEDQQRVDIYNNRVRDVAQQQYTQRLSFQGLPTNLE